MLLLDIAETVEYTNELMVRAGLCISVFFDTNILMSEYQGTVDKLPLLMHRYSCAGTHVHL